MPQALTTQVKHKYKNNKYECSTDPGPFQVQTHVAVLLTYKLHTD